MAVYRYSCQHVACPHRTCSNRPPDQLPSSPGRLDAHRRARQVDERGRGSDRRLAAALDVSVATASRWGSRCGGHRLPVAARCGVVRSSAVVEVDAQGVRVPRRDTPAGQHRKWLSG